MKLDASCETQKAAPLRPDHETGGFRGASVAAAMRNATAPIGWRFSDRMTKESV